MSRKITSLAILLVALLAGTARAQSNPIVVQTTTPGALEGGHVFAGNKVSMYSVTWHITTAANHWIMVFDATAIPANGAITSTTPLKDCQYVNGSAAQTDGTQNYDYTTHPLWMVNGITVAMSTTNCQSLTLDGANNWFRVQAQ